MKSQKPEETLEAKEKTSLEIDKMLKTLRGSVPIKAVQSPSYASAVKAQISNKPSNAASVPEPLSSPKTDQSKAATLLANQSAKPAIQSATATRAKMNIDTGKPAPQNPAQTVASDSAKNLSDKSKAAATPKSNQPSPSVSNKTLKVTSLANQSAKLALPCATASGGMKNIDSAKPALKTDQSTLLAQSSKSVLPNTTASVAKKNINSTKPAPQTTTSMVSASTKTVGSNSVKNIADKSKALGATSNVTTPKPHPASSTKVQNYNSSLYYNKIATTKSSEDPKTIRNSPSEKAVLTQGQKKILADFKSAATKNAPQTVRPSPSSKTPAPPPAALSKEEMSKTGRTAFEVAQCKASSTKKASTSTTLTGTKKKDDDVTRAVPTGQQSAGKERASSKGSSNTSDGKPEGSTSSGPKAAFTPGVTISKNVSFHF